MAEHQIYRSREVYAVDSRAYIGSFTNWKYHVTEGDDGLFPEFVDQDFKSIEELGLMVGRAYGKEGLDQTEMSFVPFTNKGARNPGAGFLDLDDFDSDERLQFLQSVQLGWRAEKGLYRW